MGKGLCGGGVASAVCIMVLLGLFLVPGASPVAATGDNDKIHYEPTWESLAQWEVPQWFEDAVLGIYVHWGIYSVPAYCDEWYPHRMHQVHVAYPPHGLEKSVYEYHCETYGDPSEFGYKDFIPMFTAEKWDPDLWAELFENIGADFAGLVAEHHDGFAMWDTEYDEYNAVVMGPCRDVVGEFAEAIKARGMRLVTTFHHDYNWWYYDPGRENELRNFDVIDPEYAGLYSPPHAIGEQPPESYWENWLAKVKEVIDKYQPDQVWFDFWLDQVPENYRMSLLAYYYNSAEDWAKEVVVTRKQTDLPLSCSVLDIERGRLGAPAPQRWQTDTSIDFNSWCDVQNPSYQTAGMLVYEMVDRTSKNGVTLLNITPRADGTIPEEQVEILNKLGDWMKINKEALYGAKWRTPWETDTMRFTLKGDYLYAIELIEVTVGHSILGVTPVPGSEIFMLGCDEPLAWHQDGDDLVIDEIPDSLPCDYAWSFKILMNPPETAEFVLSGLSISKATVEPGESFTVSVVVTNTGGESGTYTVELSIDGATMTENVTLDPGASETVSFDVSMQEEGTYEVGVDGLTESFEVAEPEEGEIPWVPVAAVVIVVIAVIGILVCRRI